MRRWISLIALLATAMQLQVGSAADLSNPLKLMFVADAEENIIDVVDLDTREAVARIETKYPVDDLIATPYAPVLVYTNIEHRLVSLYDLREQRLAMEVTLPMSPRHMVLDTSGSKIGFSDSIDGGFVLFSAYGGSVIFELEDFPPARDVLFDPNEIEIFYSNSATGSIGMIDTNLQQTLEMQVADTPGQTLSAPSRSLDGRYVYVANEDTGEVYSLNAFSKVVYRSFLVGNTPARPYTTPEGAFLYMMDKASGRFLSVEQNRFEQYVDIEIGTGIDLVTVGRFDRMNLLMSTENSDYYLFDNIRRSVVGSGAFEHTPLDSLGSVDGRTAFVAFKDSPMVAFVDLEGGDIEYIAATDNGAGAFAIGLSNNVCH
jgi:DNA-binding beta-propeller fold protein YncE